MKYDFFLFDADDTLFDFGASEQKSFAETLKTFDIQHDLNSIYRTYKAESEKLWRLLEEGKVTKEFIVVERFRKTLEAYNIEANPRKLSDTYLGFLPEFVYLNDHAVEVCTFLSQSSTVAIVTNGVDLMQRKRLERSDLKDMISFMVTSEECGYVKPHSKFFEYMMTKIENSPKDRLLVIGDRLETDIMGADSFGIDTCWYNPKSLNNPYDVRPKYEIKHLSELIDIVKEDS